MTLEFNDKTKGNVITKDLIRWDVMDVEELYVSDPVTRPGLQLADIISGAFYQAVGDARKNSEPDPECAKLLRKVMAESQHGRYLGYSVNLLKHCWALKHRPKERQIFDFYESA